MWRFAGRSLLWLAEQLGRLLFLTVSALSIRLAVLLMDRDDEADGTKVAALLAVGLVALLLAIGGPTLMRRITKLGPSGVEFEIESVRRITSIPGLFQDVPGVELGVEGFENKPLTDEQKWAYQMGADLIMYYDHENLNIDDLSGTDLALYRELVRSVGEFALVEEEYRKALYLTGHLEPIPEKTAEECYFLGEAYRMAYSNQPAYLSRARKYLEESVRKDDRPARTHYSLAWVYYEVDSHTQAVSENERAMELEPRLANEANWNAACSLVKLGKQNVALEKLRQIPPGNWWKKIYQDPELGDLKTGQYGTEFWALYNAPKAD